MQYDLKQLHDVVKMEFPYPGHFQGQGVVIVAGGPALPSAYIAVRSLRHHGCSLPIQMWHLGPAEVNTSWRRVFSQFGAQFVDTFEVAKVLPGNPKGPWPAKPFALMHSPFRETLLLDADNMVLCDPTPLFSEPLFAATGAIFWPDFVPNPGDFWAIRESTWDLLGLPRLVNAELETGQVLVNKSKVWRELNVTMHMNEHCEVFYNGLSHGDTALYRFAWCLCQREMFVVPQRPRMTIPMVRMVRSTTEVVEESWGVRLQFAPNGHPIFQHSRKWTLPAAANPKVPDFLDEELCFEWLRELSPKY